MNGHPEEVPGRDGVRWVREDVLEASRPDTGFRHLHEYADANGIARPFYYCVRDDGALTTLAALADIPTDAAVA